VLLVIINNDMGIWIRKHIVTVDILYYMPDYSDIIQEFVWQTKDITPELPKIHSFLNYWKNNIEAVIKEVNVSYGEKNDYRFASLIKDKTWH
jgi:uncharacterized protein Usg